MYAIRRVNKATGLVIFQTPFVHPTLKHARKARTQLKRGIRRIKETGFRLEIVKRVITVVE